MTFGCQRQRFRETHSFTSRPTAFARRQLRLVMDLATLQLVLSVLTGWLWRRRIQREVTRGSRSIRLMCGLIRRMASGPRDGRRSEVRPVIDDCAAVAFLHAVRRLSNTLRHDAQYREYQRRSSESSRLETGGPAVALPLHAFTYLTPPVSGPQRGATSRRAGSNSRNLGSPSFHQHSQTAPSS